MKYIQVYLQSDNSIKKGGKNSDTIPKENQECWWSPLSPFVLIVDYINEKKLVTAVRPEATGSKFEVRFFENHYCEKDLNEIIPYQEVAPKKSKKKTNNEVVLQ